MYMNYYIYILFIPMLFISIMISMISNSWITLWMMMELNLLSMIMILLFDKQMNYELLMKYFLFQSFQSYLYLINSLGLFINNFNYTSLLIMNLVILMKMSLFPFHFWYIKIMYKLSWNNIYFFSIINKIIPLYILNNIFNYNNYNFNIIYMNYFFLLISSLFSSIIALNQLNLKLIMSYSSMIQISWIIILMNLNELISLNYFLIYNLISLNMFMMFNLLNINYLNQINNIKLNNNYKIMYIMMLLISLSGLPPFFGFLMKWISINLFIMMNIKFFFNMMLIFMSLISMFFYMRILFNILMNYYMINKINIKFINFNLKLNLKFIYLNWLLMLMLIIFELF